MSENPNPASDLKPTAGGIYRSGHHGQPSAADHQVASSMPLFRMIDGDVGVVPDWKGTSQYAGEQEENDGGGKLGHGLNEDHDGMMDGEEVEGNGPSDPGFGDPQRMMVPHGGSNQLTLSFQGEVYVFDSVSPEKVQAVLLLLGGREISSSLAAFSSTLNMSNKHFSGLPHRVASLMRFREKRKERNFDKKIHYTVRKEVALRMQRSKGKFISPKSKSKDANSDIATWDCSQQWGSIDMQPRQKMNAIIEAVVPSPHQ